MRYERLSLVPLVPLVSPVPVVRKSNRIAINGVVGVVKMSNQVGKQTNYKPNSPFSPCKM